MKNNKININPLQTVLVLGGNGYLGRNIVHQLESFGCNVIVGTRGKRLICAGSIKTRLENLTSAKSWKPILEDVDIVINAVGILRPRLKESYQDIHYRSPAALACACERLNIKLIHISVLGLHNQVESNFLLSKRKGELAIKASGANYHIVRPSLLEGKGFDGKLGFGSSWLRTISKWFVHFVPSNAIGRFAPLHIKDLALAVAHLALGEQKVESPDHRIYELGGHTNINMATYLHSLKGFDERLLIRIPALLSRLISHFFDVIHFSPFSFGHFELLKFDNIAKPNRLTELLNREPRKGVTTTTKN